MPDNGKSDTPIPEANQPEPIMLPPVPITVQPEDWKATAMELAAENTHMKTALNAATREFAIYMHENPVKKIRSGRRARQGK